MLKNEDNQKYERHSFSIYEICTLFNFGDIHLNDFNNDNRFHIEQTDVRIHLRYGHRASIKEKFQQIKK